MCVHLVAGMAPTQKGQYLNLADLEATNPSPKFRKAANIKLLSAVTDFFFFLTLKLLTKVKAGKKEKKSPSLQSEL